MSIITLTVDWPHISPTYFGRKWLTFRYDDEKMILGGETLRFIDPDGECFALAKVKGVFYMTPQEFIKAGFPYYRKYELEEFLDMMNRYYDDPVSKHTECKGISYEISSLIGDYFSDDEEQSEIPDFEGEEIVKEAQKGGEE